MEKFAVDLDKVLDDFELDEDENESSSQYDKLQLQFENESNPPNHNIPMHPPVMNLGAMGGWSERPEGRFEPEAVVPVGVRSPADGQEDDDGPAEPPCNHQEHHIDNNVVNNRPDLGNENQVEQPPASSAFGVDVVCSQPLDVLPAQVSPDIGNCANAESNHPDVVDIVANNQDNVVTNSPFCDLPIRDIPPSRNNVPNLLPPTSEPLPQILQEHRLLPDLMSMNASSFPPADEPPVDFTNEPAIVMENTLQNNASNNPALVMESQSCSRIPEVVNVHQTAEQRTEENAAAGSCVSDLVEHIQEEHLRNIDVVEDSESNAVHADVFIAEAATGDSEVDKEHGNPPDLGDIKPVPICFNPPPDISDVDLDAELAELEEEQARLQGAYGGSAFSTCSTSISSTTGSTEQQFEPDVINIASCASAHQHSSNNQHDDSNNIIEASTARSLDNNESSEEDLQVDLVNVDTNMSENAVEIANSNVIASDLICSQNSLSDPEAVGISGSLDIIPVIAATAVIPNTDQIHRNESSSDCTDNPSSTITSDHEGAASQVPSNESLGYNDGSNSSVRDDSRNENATKENINEAVDTDGAARPLEASVPAPMSSFGRSIGLVAPFWIPDDNAPNCQECGVKFTVIKRRHHCRACGRVLCSSCCHNKAPLPYMDYKEARVCAPCLDILNSGDDEDDYAGSSFQGRAPDPNNPMEYCSRIPPPQQASASGGPLPTVMVPVGVLKRDGSNNERGRGSKQVIFSDGIRPGGDLTELDGSRDPPPPPYRSRAGRVARHLQPSIPEYIFDDKADTSHLEEQMRGTGPPVAFAITKNFTVLVKIVKLECCVGLEVWNIATRGLCTVGQEEIVILLEVAKGETKPPKHLFAFFHTVYQQAHKGNLVTELGHTIFTEPDGFLGCRDHGGFLYVRPTFQCLHNLVLPPAPYIFAVLIQKWETPWAKVFPLRLLLRLGAEFRYYPCPLVSSRNRKPVFGEIGHTIMNLLIDFRNYSYTVPVIQGFLIHMEEKKTSLLIPMNRYDQINKALNNSNDHVLALGGNFSPHADSHLVTIENDDGQYTTQAINIHNRARTVTGASFVVFNGALKTNSGLTAKSSIVEDGLMVQISGDMMTKLRDALRNMKDYDIACGPSSAEKADEFVLIRWVDDDNNFNIGLKSPIDDKAMDGIPSVKIHSGTDYAGADHIIRWTEVFIMQGDHHNSNNDVNLSRLSETLARAFSMALTPHLGTLYTEGQTKLALRSTMHQDSVEYEAGSGGHRLPPQCMKDLDTELIPVLHRAAAVITGEPIVLELVFHMMEQ